MTTSPVLHWNLADRAYRAYEAGDYQRAVEAARDAVALRPDLPRLRVLLVNSLVAAGDLTGAVAAADQAIAAGIANDELRITRDRLKRPAAPPAAMTAPVDPAFAAADAGYKAFARRDYAATIASARQAVALDPANDGYRLLLINALTADNRIAEAESAASEALARSPDAASLRLQRGYLRQRLRRWDAALDDLSRALQQAGLTAEQKRSARLALADVALAARIRNARWTPCRRWPENAAMTWRRAAASRCRRLAVRTKRWQRSHWRWPTRQSHQSASA